MLAITSSSNDYTRELVAVLLARDNIRNFQHRVFPYVLAEREPRDACCKAGYQPRRNNDNCITLQFAGKCANVLALRTRDGEGNILSVSEQFFVSATKIQCSPYKK